jgi:uncharacterized protein (TIGR03435 family)
VDKKLSVSGPAVGGQAASKPLMRSVILAAAAVALVAPAAAAQEPRFDVASVRPHRAADDLMFALQFHDGGRLTATGTLRMLIRTAYRLQEFQVVGPRGWIDDELYDVDARAGGDATPDQMRSMLRALLQERFALALRSERRDAPVYALSVAKPERGARLRPAAETCATSACDIRFSPGVLHARGVTLATLASELSWWVDRIVVDRTSLQERFDLELEWAPDVFPQLPLLLNSPDRPPTGRPDSSAPSIFTAVREQLGLSLEPSRGDVDVFVIDRAERPAPN